MIRKYFGSAIDLVRHDERYTVQQELRPSGTVKYVSRFLGEKVGLSATKLSAYVVAYVHRNNDGE